MKKVSTATLFVFACISIGFAIGMSILDSRKYSTAEANAPSDICRYAISTVMGRPISIIKQSGNADAFYKYNGSTYYYNCKVRGDRIIWKGFINGKWGRWRDHKLDGQINFRISGEKLIITETYNDNSKVRNTYTINKVTQ